MVIIFILFISLINSQIIEPPTRNVDLWDLFGTSTTKRDGLKHSREEVIVRLSIGELVGQKIIIPNLPWTATQDPNEQIPPDRNVPEPNPLPLNNNVTIFTFLGVPYAEPPLGERRFKAPQQLIHLPGDSPFVAFTLPPVCAQDVETRPTLFINSPYPYQSNWPGHVLASRGIVVVNVNYRLGPFGFMSLGDERGNYGLQDQRAALNWVRQHIYGFGGDLNAVTIGCVHPVANEVWSCILTRSTDDIVQAVSPTSVPSIPIEFNRYLFLPTVDGKELTAHPLWLLNNVKISNPFTVPYLTGLNKEDGIEAILEDRTLGEFTDFLQITHLYMRSWITEYAFRHNYTMNREAIIEAIESFYTYWPDPSDVWNIRQRFIELITDTFYVQPISQSAHLHSESGSRTWMYVNSYNFSAQREALGVLPSPLFPSWTGSCHECDLYLLFGFPFMPQHLLPPQLASVEWLQVDRNASQLFSSFIRQFVKYSDPNLPLDGSWSAHQPRAHWFLQFNYSSGQSLHSPGILKKDYRFEEVAFWNNYLPAQP
uniref:Carboxylesterase type B domain-containing protein n=1 Tax=Meloidogyne javanica TaxID=6303 RepID=A0A915LFM0_MELJA